MNIDIAYLAQNWVVVRRYIWIIKYTCLKKKFKFEVVLGQI
jgi:hypothetical protein